MKPLYTFTRDLQPIWGGDSLPDLSFYVEGEQSGPIIPVGVCAQILNRFGTQVYEWEASIEHDGLVLLNKLYDTSILRVGKYKYTITYILSDGRRKTYFDGAITILQRIPLCAKKY